MTKEKFVECLISSGFRLCYSEGDMTLFERGGIYLFLFEDEVRDSKDNPSFSIPYGCIKLIRSRRGSFEIENLSGESVTLLEEEDDEIGCMG